ncbi:hypothetical protein [Aureimonas jatrophae]|uniref:Uncharacterized protein n=1 Tax=Aureimonas jatrophae TaxID=1166073 RepID=A0A1H0N4Q0_9HYPH|nr:hypothetical protein [Aureimonas jatrophae]MBB3953035.1 hypothetical protein [Aureimonas jatrophae]SDO87602.1 hypothetical protein SAMN05192530_11727 [Aureimonas jatrophae]
MPLLALPLIPAALAALGEAALFVGSAAAVGIAGGYAIREMRKANEEADTQATTRTATVTCARCAQNPCAHLACGVPGSAYRGGAHGCMTGTPETVGDGLDSHHMPANSKSPLATPVGPAVQMRPEDHAQTASFRGRANGGTYAPQRALLARGQVYAAFLLDVADVKRIAAAQGDPTRYNAGLAQASAYATCLKKNGIIK